MEARPSEQVRGLYERWSIKFSADYYEAKDRRKVETARVWVSCTE